MEQNAEKSLPTTPISFAEENLPVSHYIPDSALGGAGVLNHLPSNEVIEVPDVKVKEEIVEECHHTEMDSRRGR